MLALPPAPAPAPRRQVLTATVFACAAMTTLMGGMFAIWFRFRNAAPLDFAKDAYIPAWLPKGIKVPMVPANTLLITMFMACAMSQYAIYSAKRGDRTNTGIGLGLAGLMGLAAINAQAAIYGVMKVPVNDSAYGPMFYAVTGTFLVMAIAGVMMTIITAFRYLGGRSTDRELVSATGVYWYVVTGIYCALWFIVYVTK